MTFLYIFFGIIAFIILVFCIPVRIVSDYDKEFTLIIKWLFIKYQIYPVVEKSKPKEKKKEEKQKDNKKNKDKEKKDKLKRENPIKTFYDNQGFDGLLALIKYTVGALGGTSKKLLKAPVFKELYIAMTVSNGDAARTAIEYGKLCAEVFPAMGLICASMKVKKYDLNVSPDFLGKKNRARFHVYLSVIPIKITNAVVILALKLLFKVLLKVLFTNMKSQSNKQQIEKNRKVEEK